MARNWSELLPEMLENIAAKCMSMNLKEFVMFSCVCCSWHKAAAVAKSTLVLRQQMPWLVLSDDHGDKRILFDLGNNKCYTLSLPHASRRRLHGTGSQWILTISLDGEIHLFNPLTQALLPLPSGATLYHLRMNRPMIEKERFRDQFVKRAFVVHLNNIHPLSEGEEDSSKLLVVVIYGQYGYVGNVAIAKPGDSRWTPISNAGLVSDVASCPNLGLMFFLQHNGHLTYCDLHHLTTNATASLRTAEYAPPPPSFMSPDPQQYLGDSPEMLYLLESFGDILMVRRSYDVTNTTNKFRIYKLDSQTKEWKVVPDLGDVALFVGNSPATSVKASSFPVSCEPNSIYFYDDGFSLDNRGPVSNVNINGKVIKFVHGGRDMGVYDFSNETMELFYHKDDIILSKSPVPIWFMPNL